MDTKQIKTKTMNLVLTQFALHELLYYTLVNAVKADNVHRNQSPFKDKIGPLRYSRSGVTSCNNTIPS